MVSIVISVLYSMCAYAQFDVRDVRSVANANKRQNFYILLDSGQQVEVSQLVYKIVQSDPAAFCAVETSKGMKVFKKEAWATPYDTYVFEVADTPTLTDEEVVKVNFTNGFNFTDSDIAWLGVLPGQHVKITRYRGVTDQLMVIETVERDVPLTEANVADVSAPAQSEVPQLLGEAKAKNKAKLMAMSSAKKAEKKASEEQVTITFGRK